MYSINKITSNTVVDFAAEELKKYLRMMMPECGEIFIKYAPDAKDGFRLGLMSDFGLDTSEAKDLELDDILHIDTDAEGGVITECVVKGEFAELADIASWTPNVAGVTTQNDGTVYQCVVTGSVSAELRSPALGEEDSPASCYAAGIACVNGGSIKSCENRGAVSSVTENGYSLAGGIVTINGHPLPDNGLLFGTIEESLGKGQVKAFSSTHLAYAGGIAADNLQGGTIRECTVAERVDAEASPVEGSERSLAAYAGGLVALNLDLVTDCRMNAPVSAKTEKGSAFAGGAVALNSYILYQDKYYIGTVSATLSKGDVSCSSTDANAYVGGIAAENNQGIVVSCGQSGAVTGFSVGERTYEFVGGIVGYNYGMVDRCFFVGSISDYDDNTFAGGICGLIRLPASLVINMRGNYYAAGGATSGAVYSEIDYRDLYAEYYYSLTFFENTYGYSRYITEILTLGGVTSTEEEIKSSEIYYE